MRERVDNKRFEAALLRELQWIAGQVEQESLRLESIFFGGGTPSLMEPETVRALIQEAFTLWPVSDELEITLEANPTSVEAEKFHQFKEAGVNRLSLGIQSLKPEILAFLGRQHTPEQSHHALQLASDLFPRFSFDLIYALPDQTPKDWEAELRQALDRYAPTHLSLYQLTYEPGTPFYRRFQRGDLYEPQEEIAVELFNITQSCTKAHGLQGYEVSNYAVPGQESRHNLGYWRWDPYVGIGPGAHGRLRQKGTIHSTQTLKNPEKWLTQVEKTGSGIADMVILTPEQRFLEVFSMGLRLHEGLNLNRVLKETGRSLTDWVEIQKLNTLQTEGFIQVTPEKLYLTPQGCLRLNAVLAYCLGE